MEMIWVAISITIFAEPDVHGNPQINIIPQHYYESAAECETWRVDRYSHPWGSVDPVTSKAVVAYYYDCAPQLKSDLEEKLMPLLGQGR